MHTIFVDGITTGKFAMGSNEPLGTPSPPTEYRTDSQESETIIIPSHLEARERGVGWLRMSSSLQDFNSMTEAIKDATQAIRDNKPTDVHPNLYRSIMSVLEYSMLSWRR
jgi:hypothetical protein